MRTVQARYSGSLGLIPPLSPHTIRLEMENWFASYERAETVVSVLIHTLSSSTTATCLVLQGFWQAVVEAAVIIWKKDGRQTSISRILTEEEGGTNQTIHLAPDASDSTEI